MSRQALGKGLEALIPVQGDTNGKPAASHRPNELAVDRIHANPFQPRREFRPMELEELAASIREKGIVQPVIVRPSKDGTYELIAGERRWRAAKLAGLAQVPVVIRQANDVESLEIALIENLQRENLNAMESAEAYQRLMHEFNLTQEDVAQKVGKERSSVANTLRLLKLPASVQDLVKSGKLSEGHARALLQLEEQDMIERLAEKVLRDGLSVRETERIAQGIRPSKPAQKANKKAEIKDPHARQLEDELKRKLGTQVRVIPKDKQKGRIEIEYYSLEDLDRILSLLG